MGTLFVLCACAAPTPQGGTDGGDATGSKTDSPFTGDPGALVTARMNSTVGVLLDEIPASMRDRVAQSLIGKPHSFWLTRAKNQVKLTTYRLVFREFFYGGGNNKKQLPFPPEDVQEYTFTGTPRRESVNGHDYVLRDYTMYSVLVSPVDSPEKSDQALNKLGGKVSEPFILPIDPELVFQRTRFACMDEEDFPPESVNSEEVDSFYDQDCTVETELSLFGQCHGTEQPTMDCVDALDAHIGRVDTSAEFERIAWDQATADKYRTGVITNPTGSDLQLIEEEFRQSRVIYKYVPPGHCTLLEQCVGGSGWRRLLTFPTSDKNTGTKTLDIGAVDYYISGKKGTLGDWGLFEYSSCHNHYHFKYYGDFFYGPEIESKNGFCLQSTARAMNHEHAPLTNDYGGCDYQGVEAGWADQYKSGLPCQWVDVTTVDTSNRPVTHSLSFTSNPLGFLCEGSPILDSHGDPTYELTSYTTADGDPVYKPACNYYSGWLDNNSHAYDVTLPVDGNGQITAPCDRGQIGPLRNCGFVYDTPKKTCTPGQPVSLTCSIGANKKPQAVRVCEYSHALGEGTACFYEEALTTASVTGTTTVTFTCPAARSSSEPGGAYSLYTAPVYPDDARAQVTCTP
jgi:hypothetical protein